MKTWGGVCLTALLLIAGCASQGSRPAEGIRISGTFVNGPDDCTHIRTDDGGDYETSQQPLAGWVRPGSCVTGYVIPMATPTKCGTGTAVTYRPRGGDEISFGGR